MPFHFDMHCVATTGCTKRTKPTLSKKLRLSGYCNGILQRCADKGDARYLIRYSLIYLKTYPTFRFAVLQTHDGKSKQSSFPICNK